MNTECDVVVVGGSFAAAACAQRLSDAGLEVVVLEKKALPRHKICSGILSPRGKRFLEENFGRIPDEALHDPNSYYERCTYPAKTAKDAGVILAAGSDAPVLTKDPQPFVNMEIGVTRARHGLPPLSPWQRLSIRDLVDAYTINGAHALNRASEIGSLEAGKSADFIIVDQNILALGDEGRPEKI